MGTAVIPSGVPVTPDAEEARRWAEQELANRVYDDSPSLLDRIVAWIGDLLEALTSLGGSAPPALAPLVVVLVVAALLAVAVLVGGRVRRRRQTAAATASAQLFDDARTSADLTAAADGAAARGDWAGAVLDRYRAIIRSLDERALLEDRAGLTAHEAAELAAAALPTLAERLRWAGGRFDAVAYGHAPATAEDDAALRDLAAGTRAPAGMPA